MFINRRGFNSLAMSGLMIPYFGIQKKEKKAQIDKQGFKAITYKGGKLTNIWISPSSYNDSPFLLLFIPKNIDKIFFWIDNPTIKQKKEIESESYNVFSDIENCICRINKYKYYNIYSSYSETKSGMLRYHSSLKELDILKEVREISDWKYG